MTAFVLSDFLEDFGPSRQSATGAVAPSRIEQPAVPPPGIEEIVRAEVAKAEAALAERLAAAHAAELEALRQDHAARMDEALGRIGATSGETIALRLGEMEERLGRRAATAAARILGSFLSDELQKRSIESLAESIRAAVSSHETSRVEIRGPQSLNEALQAALGDQAGRFGFVEAPGFDLSVTIDGDLLETRLSEWSTVLSEILE